jgi:hypothetical protein
VVKPSWEIYKRYVTAVIMERVIFQCRKRRANRALKRDAAKNRAPVSFSLSAIKKRYDTCNT